MTTDTLMGFDAAWVWIFAGAALLALEVMLPGVFLLWLGIAACAIGGLLMSGVELSVLTQLVAFGVLAVALAVFARMVLRYGVSVSDQSQLNLRGQHYVGQVVTVDEPIIGGRGTHGNFAPKSELNDWFRKAYFDRFATWPTYPSYKMALALLGVKAAYEKAAKAAGGKQPTQEQVAAALKGLEFDSPSGKVKMALSGGHQAIQDTAYATHTFDKATNQAVLANIKVYKAECVNPPEGIKSADWIKSGFKGAKCN